MLATRSSATARRVAYNSWRPASFPESLLPGDRTVPRILSLQGLVVAVWVACLALMVLLGGILVGRVWHPHFLPVTLSLAFIVLAALGFVIGASWRIIRGPR